MNRFFGRATRAVRKPWHMYPLGCLFGLGFDTATEVALLVSPAPRAASGLPFYAILCLPILFAAGMSLFDTIDGAFMNFAYGWAFSKPVRKIFYNITITGALGGGGAADRRARAAGGAPEKLDSRLDVARDRPQPTPATGRRRCSCSRGARRWRSGASAGSRSAGRRRCDDARVRRPAAGVPGHRRRRRRAARRRRPLSAVRRRVLQAMFDADGPLPADAPSRPELDQASVYRALEYLEELGAVRHVHAGHGPGLYLLTVGGEREYLACERCRRVTARRAGAARRRARRDPGAVRPAGALHALPDHGPVRGLRAAHGAVAAATAAWP